MTLFRVESVDVSGSSKGNGDESDGGSVVQKIVMAAPLFKKSIFGVVIVLILVLFGKKKI